MALESMAKRKDQRTVELDTICRSKYYSVVDQDIGTDTGCGGVSIGVTGIGSKDLHVERTREGHEQAHARVLDASRVGAGETMEFRSKPLGSVTTVAVTTSAIRFEFLHPMLPEDEGTRGTRARFTVPFKVGEAIKLFSFGTFLDGPGFQVAKFATSEQAKSMFGRVASGWKEGMKGQFQIIIRDSFGRGVGAEDLRSKRMDCMKLVNAKEKVLGVSAGVGTGKGSRGKSDGERGGSEIRSNIIEGGLNFDRGISQDIVHKDNKSAEVLSFRTDRRFWQPYGKSGSVCRYPGSRRCPEHRGRRQHRRYRLGLVKHVEGWGMGTSELAWGALETLLDARLKKLELIRQGVLEDDGAWWCRDDDCRWCKVRQKQNWEHRANYRIVSFCFWQGDTLLRIGRGQRDNQDRAPTSVLKRFPYSNKISIRGKW